jgi:hypothetical protein
MASRLKTLEVVGQVLRLQIQSLEVRSSADVDTTLELAIKNRVGDSFCTGWAGECVPEAHHRIRGEEAVADHVQ